MFDLTSIATNTENPTFLTIVFTVLLSFLLATLIAFTYEKTSRQVARPDNYIQALVLVAIVSATVMQAIGDSLARGLGMLGALAIIRFRTTIRNPRNIVFMFGSIAAGIACGVYGFVVAFCGTVGFCATAFILRVTPFSTRQNMVGTLRVELPHGAEHRKNLEAILKKHCRSYSMQNSRYFNSERRAERVEYRYQLKLKNEDGGWELSNQVKMLPEVERVQLIFNAVGDII